MRKTTLVTGLFIAAVVALAAGCGSDAAKKSGPPAAPVSGGAPQAASATDSKPPTAKAEPVQAGAGKPARQEEEKARAAWALLDQVEQLVRQGKAAEAAGLGEKLDELFDSYAKNVPDAALRERVEDAVHSLGRALKRDPEKVPELVRQVREGLEESARAMGFALP